MPRRRLLILSFFLLLLPDGIAAQSADSSLRLIDGDSDGHLVRSSAPVPEIPERAFSRLSLGGQVSPLGIGVAISTNLDSHLNTRFDAGLFNQNISITSNGFNTDASLRLASARVCLDVYPFHNGFRISPGLMFYNQNRVSAADTIASGTSFTLNSETFYSAHPNQATGATPVNGTALLNLHSARPAFTITGGWGNTAPRSGHWSFPVEVGVAVTGAPRIEVNLTGWACLDQAGTECTDIANPDDPIAVQVQNDLHAQVNTWTQNLNWLKTYPIVSVGVAYAFHTGRR